MTIKMNPFPRNYTPQPKNCVLKECATKVSPPFEGGVAGTIDYMIFTKVFTRPGWLIYSFLFTFISMKNKNLFNRKDLKSFRSSLRNRYIFAEAALCEVIKSKNLKEESSEVNIVLVVILLTFVVLQINHPGRNQPLQCFNYHCAAATPPSKGGESIINELKFDIKILVPLLILPVKHFSDNLG